jgi:hypothetical protein
VQVDRDVVAAPRQSSSGGEVVSQPRKTAAPRDDDQFVDVRIALDNGRGVWLNDIGDVCVRIVAPERAEERCRENDVSNRTQPDQ